MKQEFNRFCVRLWGLPRHLWYNLSVLGSSAQLAGCTIVGVVGAEIWMVLEGLNTRRLLVIPQFFHLLHNPQEISAS